MRRGLVGGVVVAALLTGCGSDDESSKGRESASADAPVGQGGADETNRKAITKAEFIKRADAICRRSSKRIVRETFAALRKSNDLSDPSKIPEASAGVVRTVFSPLVERQAREIRALGLPQGDEDRVEAFLDALLDVARGASQDPETFAQLDTTDPSENPYQKADQLAEQYGFKDCPRV